MEVNPAFQVVSDGEPMATAPTDGTRILIHHASRMYKNHAELHPCPDYLLIDDNRNTCEIVYQILAVTTLNVVTEGKYIPPVIA